MSGYEWIGDALGHSDGRRTAMTELGVIAARDNANAVA